ncbi:hypothetical protein [Streptomyces sp. NPDC051665]|uniref:hypothetical protein n=1 Tax=Streptomyces sp. NPDC051665 TaxID=3154647 RepID=UPI00342A3617
MTIAASFSVLGAYGSPVGAEALDASVDGTGDEQCDLVSMGPIPRCRQAGASWVPHS